ncbi:MAG: glutamate-5-semialdehyde dehydrogenase [Defluviitaleaceae bacterium]|nr:glutamate-5-semialdehyde dehydrogenase [Defluviitaleaceae bacterium]
MVNMHSPKKNMSLLDEMGRKAKSAAKYLAVIRTSKKNDILSACASSIKQNSSYILTENKKDMDGLDQSRGAFADRLLLNDKRIAGIADGIRDVALLEDPVNEILSMRTLPNGLTVGQKRVPLGAVGMIYEARPNVTADAFALCLKAGNSCILRGGREAIFSNTAIVNVFQDTLESCGHPRELLQLITDTSRETARDFMRMNEFIDVLIPRGGGGLIKTTLENSTIPVIETGTGNCHIYADDGIPFHKAVSVIINAKVQRPSVCNACEKLLVNKNIADTFLPLIGEALLSHGVEIRGDSKVCSVLPYALPAADDDWHTEYLDLVIGIKVVDSIDEAIEHIDRYSTKHSDAILTESHTNAQKFLSEVDSAAVYVNASTRFTDGGEFGLGAEMGISTQKIHARGPMGLKTLTSTKYIVYGDWSARK